MPTPVSDEQSPRGSKARERSRDRQQSASAQARAKEREGEQLPRSVLAAIYRLEVAVSALDQASRNQFRTISKLDSSYVDIQNRVNDMANQLSGAMTKSGTAENHLVEACGNIIDRFQLNRLIRMTCN